METKDEIIKILKEMKEVLTQIKRRTLTMKELNESSIKLCSIEDFQAIVKENDDIAQLGREVEELENEIEDLLFNR
jgi:hypothetical protein|nr:MAG TPA: Ku C terminal domain like [Caudoviricetes sp.]